MDGLLAARVVSMLFLGLVTWIVGEDTIPRVRAIRENPDGSVQSQNSPHHPWFPDINCSVTVTNLEPFKCDINTFTSKILSIRIVCFEKKLISQLPQLLAAMMIGRMTKVV